MPPPPTSVVWRPSSSSDPFGRFDTTLPRGFPRGIGPPAVRASPPRGPRPRFDWSDRGLFVPSVPKDRIGEWLVDSSLPVSGKGTSTEEPPGFVPEPDGSWIRIDRADVPLGGVRGRFPSDGPGVGPPSSERSGSPSTGGSRRPEPGASPDHQDMGRAFCRRWSVMLRTSMRDTEMWASRRRAASSPRRARIALRMAMCSW